MSTSRSPDESTKASLVLVDPISSPMNTGAFRWGFGRQAVHRDFVLQMVDLEAQGVGIGTAGIW